MISRERLTLCLSVMAKLREVKMLELGSEDDMVDEVDFEGSCLELPEVKH